MYDIRSAMLNIGIVFTPGKFKINLEKTWKTPGILVNLRSTDLEFNITFKTIFEFILTKVVLCIQIRFVSTEKTTRIASRASC